MQAHLETFPVLEAMRADTPCPLCFLYREMEQKQLDYTLGGSVMEPDVRIYVNETGICSRHQQMLYSMNNRLGQALLCDSHSKEILKKLGNLQIGKAKRFSLKQNSPVSELIDQLEAMNRGCVICEGIENALNDYRYTLLHLWKTSEEFRGQWLASKGVCLKHACELLKSARQHLSPVQQTEFAEELLKLIIGNVTEDEQDLDRFIQKFDYRKQDLPWGNAKNALPRMVNRLRGRVLEDG